MNQNHKIDMRRPFAAEYAEARRDVRFWDNLKAPSQQGVAMYFEDAEARLFDIERACGMSKNTLRYILATRGMFMPTNQQPRLRPRSGCQHAAKPSERAPNAYKGPKAMTAPATGAISGAIVAISAQLVEVTTQIEVLNAEYNKLNEALNTLKGL